LIAIVIGLFVRLPFQREMPKKQPPQHQFSDVRIASPAIIALAALALASALYPFGWFAPLVFPDTAAYENALSAPNMWGELRHPLYGWILATAEASPLGKAALPALQFTVQALGAMALTGAARLAGADRRASLALGLAAVFGQSVVIWGRALIPEVFASGLLLVALALTLIATRERLFWPAAILAALTLGMAYTLRPIVLPAIATLPALYLLLCLRERQGWRLARALLLLVLLAVPFLAQSAHRYREVGDFGLVSFGGFGSMGMSAQILTLDIVPRLPEGQRALAIEVLAAKQRAEEAQTAMPLFRNSERERSFRATAIDGFDTFARNFDEILWGQLVNLRKADESWVAFNRRMGALSGAVLRAAPERHAMWIVGASARLVGRLFVYNAAFMLALAAFGGVALWNIARHGSALGGGAGESWTLLSLIVGAWVVSTTAVTVVAAFPALRYTDAGGLLLTALPLYGLFLAVRRSSAGRA
jgi:hypothetical protein